MKLNFLHGWGFDAGLWREVAALLPEFACELGDRGYFHGGPSAPPSDPADLVVAHSFGTLVALHGATEARGLVAINGFDCFTARPDFPGVPPRVVDRMLARFAEDPVAVLADFRQRCGEDRPFSAPNLDRLGEDLRALRDWDCRRAHAMPILSLHGGADPIVPPAMQAATFAGAAHIKRAAHPAAGHLLPLTHPEFCADHIRRFASAFSPVPQA